MCLMPSLLQKSLASLVSFSGKAAAFNVMAIALSPNTSCATFRRNVESTPLENATATLSNDFKYSFKLLYLTSKSLSILISSFQ